MRLSKHAIYIIMTVKMRAAYAPRTTWTNVATNAARRYVQVTSVVQYSHIIKTVRMLYVGFVARELTEN